MQGKAVHRKMMLRRMLGAGEPELELPWTAGWEPQLNGLPASWPWGETEVPHKGHLGREADTSVLPLKPEFGVQAWWQSPRRQCGGPAGPGEPWARQWHPHESWCGGTVPVPSAQLELPKELLLRWLNLLAGKPGTLRLSNP